LILYEGDIGCFSLAKQVVKKEDSQQQTGELKRILGQSRVVVPKESKAGGEKEEDKVGQGGQRHI